VTKDEWLIEPALWIAAGSTIIALASFLPFGGDLPVGPMTVLASATAAILVLRVLLSRAYRKAIAEAYREVDALEPSMLRPDRRWGDARLFRLFALGSSLTLPLGIAESIVDGSMDATFLLVTGGFVSGIALAMTAAQRLSAAGERDPVEREPGTPS
jgi:hypothetical protein